MDWCQLRAERLAERIREGARAQYEFPRRDHYRRIRESSLEDSVITGLRSLSIDGDNGLSKLQEQPNHEESETEPIMNHDPTATQDSAATQEPTANQKPTMATVLGTQNGIVIEDGKIPNVIVMASAEYPLIMTFRGKEGEDVERFLKNV